MQPILQRLAADAVLELWRQAGEAQLAADGADARLELLGAARSVADWYRDLAAGLGRRTAVPAPLPRDPDEEARLVHSLRRDLRGDDGHATATAVRIIWTSDHLNVARRLQPSLAAAAKASDPAREVASDVRSDPPHPG